jgi:hypothetical protein
MTSPPKKGSEVDNPVTEVRLLVTEGRDENTTYLLKQLDKHNPTVSNLLPNVIGKLSIMAN